MGSSDDTLAELRADIERLRAELEEYKLAKPDSSLQEDDLIAGHPIVRWQKGKYDRRAAAAKRAARQHRPLLHRVRDLFGHSRDNRTSRDPHQLNLVSNRHIA